MRAKILAAALAAIGGLAVAAPASALTQLSACALTDVSPSAQACEGFYAGNLVSGSTTADQKTALDLLGFDTSSFDFSSYTKLDSLNGATTLNFGTALSGLTYIAVHYGNGVGSPGRPDNSTKGDGDDTAFYRLDLTSPTDTITLNFAASSNAILYSTGGGGAVPEPATWAMMLIGFFGLGAAMRSRKAALAV